MAVTELIKLNFHSDLGKGLRRDANAIGQFSRNAKARFNNVAMGANKLSAGIDKLTPRFAGLAAAIGGGALLRNSAAFGENITRLGLNMRMNVEDTKKLRTAINDVARTQGIAVKREDLLQTLTQIQVRTGKLLSGPESLKALAQGLTATGANATEFGELAAAAMNFGVADNKLYDFFNVINEQGKDAKATLSEIAKVAPRITAAYQGFGSGTQGFKELNALFQTLRSTKGSSEETATMLEGYQRALRNRSVQGKLKRELGVSVFDAAGNQRSGKAINLEIINAIKSKYRTEKEQADAISEIFNDDMSKGAVRAMVSGEKEYRKYMNLQIDSNALMEDSAIITATFSGSMISLNNQFAAFADESLAPLMASFANLMNNIGSARLDTAFKWITRIAIALVGIYAANKTFQLGRFAVGTGIKTYGVGKNTLNMMRGRGWSGGKNSIAGKNGGGLLSSVSGGLLGSSPTRPMYVAMVGGGGFGMDGGRGKKGMSKFSQLGRMAKMGAGIPVLGAGITASQIGMQAFSGEKDAKAKAGIQLGGAAIGGLLGGTIGSIVPGAGTAIGAGIGMTIGQMIADSLDDKLAPHLKIIAANIAEGNLERKELSIEQMDSLRRNALRGGNQ